MQGGKRGKGKCPRKGKKEVSVGGPSDTGGRSCPQLFFSGKKVKRTLEKERGSQRKKVSHEGDITGKLLLSTCDFGPGERTSPSGGGREIGRPHVWKT